MCREYTLRLSRGPNGVLGAAEGNKKGIPLRVDLVAAVLRECLPQQPSMVLERVAVSIRAQLVEQLSRPLDVRKEESDGAGREVRYRGRILRLQGCLAQMVRAIIASLTRS